MLENTLEGTKAEAYPNISVVICTRDRGSDVARTVTSVLQNGYPAYELLVIDQSRDDSTARCLDAFRHDGRVRYLHSQEVGLSRGRNLGVSESRGEIIAFTDDDCEVPTNWLQKLVEAFHVDNRLGLVFGNVLAGPYDSTKGFIPAYVRNIPFMARSIWQKHQVEGIGACMGIRRCVLDDLGGFDQILGIGAPLMTGEESDLTIRILLAGYFVYESPDIMLVHYGFRAWEDGNATIKNYWFGTGAMFAKHLKCGHLSIIYNLTYLAYRWIFGRSRVASSLGIRACRLIRLASFVRGFVIGFLTPVNRVTNHFLSQDDKTASKIP